MLARLASAIVTLWVATSIAAAEPILPGTQAPDFALQDVDGRTYTLSQYRGDVVLLMIIGSG